MEVSAEKKEYDAAVERLCKFCQENTELECSVDDSKYPICITFLPNRQLTLFSENVDEDGAVNDMSVIVGLSTKVQNSLNFKMSSDLLKKIIKKAEKVGMLYYHAFRAEADREENENSL